jgi:hypothetical protein
MHSVIPFWLFWTLNDLCAVEVHEPNGFDESPVFTENQLRDGMAPSLSSFGDSRSAFSHLAYGMHISSRMDRGLKWFL